MTDKSKVIIEVIIIVTAYAIGRFSAPEKIKVETKIVEVEKKVTDTDKTKHKKVTVVETTKPDGTKTKTTVITDDTETKKKETDTSHKNTDVVREEIRGSQKVTVSALLGIPLSFGLSQPVYGASITKPIFGPITIGGFYFTPNVGGVSLGLTF